MQARSKDGKKKKPKDELKPIEKGSPMDKFDTAMKKIVSVPKYKLKKK